ncbi:MAG: hypothetical protein Q4D98_13110 [Planctomycetia bacterium]|nr:hypothetical protein [Planctomycetia bacterium]
MLDNDFSRNAGTLDPKSEDLLAQLRGISICFDEKGADVPASRDTLSRLNTRIASETLPGSGMPRPSSESREYLLQSFSRYREQLRDDFDQLRTTVNRRTSSTLNEFREPEPERRTLRSATTMEDIFREPLPFAEPARSISRETSVKSPSPLSETVWQMVEVAKPQPEPKVPEVEERVAEEPVVEECVVEERPIQETVPVREEKPILDSNNPFSRMLSPQREPEPKRAKAAATGAWRQTLLCFAAGGLACGGVILGLAFLDRQPMMEAWNLGFSFLISGTASLLAFGTFSAFGMRRVCRCSS